MGHLEVSRQLTFLGLWHGGYLHASHFAVTRSRAVKSEAASKEDDAAVCIGV